jgi:FlaA1/EpsC-like NDP-sugar epimerase
VSTRAPFLSRFNRVALAMTHDLGMAAAAFLVSLYLRVGDEMFDYPVDFLAGGTALFVVAAAIAFRFTGLSRGVWRYVSIDDLAVIARGTTLALLLFVPAMFLWTRLEIMPRSTIFIGWFVLFALLTGPRLIYRTVREGKLNLSFGAPRADQVQVLLVGANDGAELFLQANRRRGRAPYFVVGILDDAERRKGRQIGGVDVLGPVNALEAILADLRRRGFRPQRLVVATSMDGTALSNVVDLADRCGLTAVRLPRINELNRAAQGDNALDVSPIAIEDLLGRPQTVLDRAAMDELVRGRRVLVTGAGGSIGAELVRQIAQRGPAQLDLIDNSEFALYAIDREVEETWPHVARRATIGDVREAGAMRHVLARAAPEIVFHAAALKHVPLLEANPAQGALTNAIGTRNVAHAAVAAGAHAMVLISTDKAVNPTNVLGATKRLAEIFCQARDAQNTSTRFVAVRFGNVLGSSGSVVPLFQRQLAAGGPITVTHPDIERYFMTIREACELVLQASVLALAGSGTARGSLLVLEMGGPVRILDLAKRMIRLAGKRPERDIAISFTGLRPGEKLFEELFYKDEQNTATSVPGIQLAGSPPVDAAAIEADLAALEAIALRCDDAGVVATLQRILPSYKPV